MSEQTGLEGPFPLQRGTIDNLVIRISPGAFILGNGDAAKMVVRYIGRSDHDVASRLKDFLGFYSWFEFGYFETAKAAFEKECQLYHEFGDVTLENKLHPSRRAFSGWRCPRCGIFDY